MNCDSESDGTAKGSLSNRLHILNILLRISRKKKLRCQFKNINVKSIKKINKIFIRFYTPVKYVINPNNQASNFAIFASLEEPLNYKLQNKKATFKEVELLIVKICNFKKGIGSLEEILKNNDKTHTFPIVDDLPDKESIIKYIESNALGPNLYEEYAKIYDLNVNDIGINEIYEILLMRCCSSVIFGQHLNDSEIKEIITSRIMISEITDKILKFDQETEAIEWEKTKDSYNVEQTLYELAKVNKKIGDYSAEIAKITRKINEYELQTIKTTKIKGFDTMLKGFLGLGFGILTLPFSKSRSFILGSSLINKSINGMKKAITVEEEERQVRNYLISANDITSSTARISSSAFLCAETIKKIRDLKYDVLLHKNEIPNYEEIMQKILLMEKGFVIKAEKIKVLEESLNKNKIKVLERKIG